MNKIMMLAALVGGSLFAPQAHSADLDLDGAYARIQQWFNIGYDGDAAEAFSVYAELYGGGDDMDVRELTALLADARIGHNRTRKVWADGIIKDLDVSKDNAISWEEFRAALRQN